MSKLQLQFKDPDLLYELAVAQCGKGDKNEAAREAWYDKYTEFGDYGVIEIDSKTLEAKLIPWEDRK